MPDRLEVAATPRFPLALPGAGGADGVLRRRGRWLERLLVIAGSPVLIGIRPERSGRSARFVLAAEAIDPERIRGRAADRLTLAGESTLRSGLGRLRHAFGFGDDLAPFREAFREDPLLGPVLRRRLLHRPPRRPDPWEALLWAITEQLIEYRRAVAIQRRLVRRLGLRVAGGPGEGLATVPSPGVIAACAPAELRRFDLGDGRCVAAVRVAREVAAGRIDPGDPAGDGRLLRIPQVGPWTTACLALRGRGEPDALLAGDLAQLKLVGYLAGHGRLATVEEVRRFYRRYAPSRGLAGELLAADLVRAFDGPGNRARIGAAARDGGSPGPPGLRVSRRRSATTGGSRW